MSNQAGIWQYDKRPVSADQFAAFDKQLTLQGPDRQGDYKEPGFVMLHCAFYITPEDSFETQPVCNGLGNVLTWDGRLDNRNEVLTELGQREVDLPTDAEIVSAALAAWGNKAFPRLIGDWALAWWNPRERRLLLARDYIGARKLYYLAASNSFYWSTDLAALVLHSGYRYNLCDAYFAGYLSNHPEPQLTPYQEIQLVSPGGYLEITPNTLDVRRYWSFNDRPVIRYRLDAEYEEHFRHLFRRSVSRRLRTGYPILADLSGGLDSSSVVCMAYDILKAGEARATLNTISSYSLEEPGGDERPYFTVVEAFIGKTGTHIEYRSESQSLLQPLHEPHFAPLPGYFNRILEEERRLLMKIGNQGSRLHFSGLGGDELLGGVQNPVPNLAELLWHLHVRSFWRQTEAWALKQKTTIWSLSGRSIAYLAPLWLRVSWARRDGAHLASWLRPEFVRKERIHLRRIQMVTDKRDWLPGLPSPDSRYLSLAASIAGYLPRFTFAEQSVRPYYDRDLVQFLFSISGEQLLRPHQRRSLMRRALSGVVPTVVLERKTTWLGRRQPALQMLANAEALFAMLPRTPIGDDYVDASKIQEDINSLRQGKEMSILLLERALGSCLLYRDLQKRNLVLAHRCEAAQSNRQPC